jgi:hypothetical protein
LSTGSGRLLSTGRPPSGKIDGIARIDELGSADELAGSDELAGTDELAQPVEFPNPNPFRLGGAVEDHWSQEEFH